MNAPRLANVLKILAILTALVMVFGPVGTVAAESDVPTQASCHALSEKYGNVAQTADPEWQACFLAGWVNWVFDPEHALPEEAPEWLTEAMQKGGYVQITEPWKAGCDNTLEHPGCSIGFLKLFPEWKSLKAFLEFGEFTQVGVTKSGPWDRGSLWFTNSFVLVPDGKKLTTAQTKAFCEDQVAIVFAIDGGYVLPSSAPCEPETKYYLRERWNGSCIGNELPDAACNVGEVLVFTDWNKLTSALEESGFQRGSVFADHPTMQAMAPIDANPDDIETYSPFWAWVGDNWILLVVIGILLIVVVVLIIRR